MSVGAAGAVAALDAAVDGLFAVSLDELSDEELLGFTVEVERVVRRLPAVQDAITAAVDGRGVAHGRGCATAAVLLRQLLRLTHGEAKARVRAADRFARRRAVSGELLPPLLPTVAAARAAGDISPKHATDIAATIDALPAAVDDIVDGVDQVAAIEATLVEHARTFTPDELGKISQRLLATLDPDGDLTDLDYRERRRDLTVHQRPDGSVGGTFEGTAEFGEVLLTVLDALAAPNPTTDGMPDTRTAGQRRHDGMLDAFRLVLRARLLPSINGVAATVLLIASETDWTTDQGLARTGHGALIPVPEAKRIAAGDTRTLTVTMTDTAGITGWTDTRRYFTETQRLAMAARDHGCSFPGCTSPPAWCQADHVLEHSRGGPTTTDNGHLLCGHHHRTKNRYGWTITTINNRPHWTPPPWLDPAQTPRRNHAHDPLGVG